MSYEVAATVYDAIHADLPYDAWVSYLCGFLPPPMQTDGKVCQLLDCGCGTGQVAVRLAGKGYRVIASDVSACMLETAAQNARQRGVQATFVKQAMQHIRLHRTVQCITCVFDPINHLCDLQQVKAFFCSAYAALASGGVLLFDALTACAFDLREQVSAVDNARVCSMTYRRPLDKNRRASVQITAFLPHKSQSDSYERIDFELKYRVHTQAELTALLQECGFAHVAVYAHLTHDAPREDTYRLQFVANK